MDDNRKQQQILMQQKPYFSPTYRNTISLILMKYQQFYSISLSRKRGEFIFHPFPLEMAEEMVFKFEGKRKIVQNLSIGIN